MTSKNQILSNLKIPTDISGLLHQYHDRYLADDSLSDINVLLLSVYLIEYKNKKSGAKLNEVKDLFIYLGRKEDPNYRVAFHNVKKQKLIEEKQEKLYLLIDGLKRIRIIIGQTGKLPVYIIKSGGNFTAVRLFEEFLTNEIKDKEILLCDPYISPSTLYPFVILKDKIDSIKILSSNLYDSEKFHDYKKKFEKEMKVNLEVRLNTKLHDRYLICGEKCWSLGSSIKDLGNKDTTIKELDSITTSLKELFLERWNEKTESSIR
ncbi:MAG: hypothetical protein QXL17_06285 [Candidatus Thermoplasmatota archaeon]